MYVGGRGKWGKCSTGKKEKKKADLYILFKILIKERKLYMYIFCLMDLVESNNHRVKSHCKYFNMTCAFFSF